MKKLTGGIVRTKALRASVRKTLACSFVVPALPALVLLSSAQPPARADETEQIKQGFDAVMQAQTLDLKPGKNTLEFYGGSVELNVPETYTVKKLNVGNTPGYTFEGPKNAEGKNPSLIMYLLLAPAGQEIPPTPELMNAMLRPFKTRLTDYKEEPKEALKVAGREYANTGYSGSLNDRAIKGTIFVSKLKNGFLVVTATDAASSWDTSEPSLTGIVKSFKFTEKEVALKPAESNIKAPETITATANPQKLPFKVYRMELDCPDGYVISKMTPDDRIEYSFSGPKNADGTRPGVMFFIIDFNEMEKMPSNKELMETLLKPGKQSLENWNQTDNQPTEINGVSFENTDFSGVIPGGKSIKGFFYVALLKNALCVLTGRDSGEHFKDTETTLRNIVKSCKVVPQ